MPAPRFAVPVMPGQDLNSTALCGPLGRRAWLRLAALGGAGLVGLEHGVGPGMAAEGPRTTLVAEEDDELKRARDRTRKITGQQLHVVRSPHHQAIGDASESFIKLTLADCERLALEYLNHFRSRGFDVKLPERRMTLIVFQDERPFNRFAEGAPPGVVGFYSRPANWLVLFDFRNVPMSPTAAGQTNMETVTHEATHQLTFNTGLLARQGEIPLCIVEGLAMYGERRRLRGPSEPGQINLRRLDEMAHCLRRTKWIPVSVLLSDDRGWFAVDLDRRTLGYAQSWLLVYHLMTDPNRLPQFRTYLESIRDRKDKAHRLDDARASFGDLDQLDTELRRREIRLQRGQ